MLSQHVFIYAIDRAIKQFVMKAAGVAFVFGLGFWFFSIG